MQESFFTRCAPIELAQKTMLAQVRKLVTKNAKKTQKNHFGLNGRTKQKMPKIPESQRKIRKSKTIKQ